MGRALKNSYSAAGSASRSKRINPPFPAGLPRLEGRHLYAAMIALFGAVWLLSGDFVEIWQPPPENLPARQIVVYLCGLASVAGGAALLDRRAARFGAIAPVLIFPLFLWRWITRIILLPAVAGTWSGCAEDLLPWLAAVLILSADPKTHRVPDGVLAVCRIAAGLCAISFGAVHFEALEQTAAMVPQWIPGSGSFWAQLTGVLDIVGGIALVANLKPRAAAHSLAAMYMVFEILIWLPRLWENPGQAIVWTGNAVTIVLAASMLVLADSVGRWRSAPDHSLGGPQPKPPMVFDKGSSAAPGDAESS